MVFVEQPLSAMFARRIRAGGFPFAQLFAQSSTLNNSPKQDSERERAEKPSRSTEADETGCLRRDLHHAHRHGRKASTTPAAFPTPLRCIRVTAL